MYRDITVIHGTHRPQDLVPVFLDLVGEVAPAHYEQMMCLPFGPVPAYALEDDSADWWDSDECTYLVGELFDVLNEHAPDGCYFGAHPGDGSDFGFWTFDSEE